MISQVSGEVVMAREHERGCEVVLDVGGIGYRISVTPSTLANLSALGERVTLHTYLHVREEEMSLYGFESSEERDLFEILIGASGVGPKVGQAILATHSPRALRTLISAGDTEALTLVPGIGSKRAQKLLLELRDKISRPALEAVPPAADSAIGDVSAALSGLGYSAAEIREALAGVSADEEPEAILREALRALGQSA
ncbi:MAG: Holliday junction branch migration protein RuvA [Acidobacteria bacterium]|nr:MAG: Holliday junction branch migration protein RuvA [Acidobacteriota bacterium]